MDAKRNAGFRVAGWLAFLSILLALMGGAARGEELYTRTDELSCGNTVVQAFTTCTEDSRDVDTALCTEQHFLFTDKKTGASVRVQGPGEPVADRDVGGGKIGAHEFVAEWACLWGRKGPACIGFILGASKPVGHKGTAWFELFDLKGRMLASDRPGEEKKFDRTWRSLGLPPYPILLAPWEPIELFKTDRQDTDIWLNGAHRPL